MQLHIHSPTVKVVRRRGYAGEPSRTIPIYTEHDTVEGTVLLDPHLCATPGRLTIAVSRVYSCV